MTEEAIRRKLRPWDRARLFGSLWPVMVVAGNAAARDLFARIGYELGIPLVAVTEADLKLALQTYPGNMSADGQPVKEAFALKFGDDWVRLSETAEVTASRWMRNDLERVFVPGGLEWDEEIDAADSADWDFSLGRAREMLLEELGQLGRRAPRA